MLRQFCQHCRNMYNVHRPQAVKHAHIRVGTKTPTAPPQNLFTARDILFPDCRQHGMEGKPLSPMFLSLNNHPQREREIGEVHAVDRPKNDELLGVVVLVRVEAYSCNLQTARNTLKHHYTRAGTSRCVLSGGVYPDQQLLPLPKPNVSQVKLGKTGVQPDRRVPKQHDRPPHSCVERRPRSKQSEGLSSRR